MKRFPLSAVMAVSVLTFAFLTSAGSAASASEPPNAPMALGCWTTFDPPNPHGGPMHHYYNNCDDEPYVVAPGYWLNGQLTVDRSRCAYVSPGNNQHDGDLAYWWHASTIPSGATYVTAFCF